MEKERRHRKHVIFLKSKFSLRHRRESAESAAGASASADHEKWYRKLAGPFRRGSAASDESSSDSSLEELSRSESELSLGSTVPLLMADDSLPEEEEEEASTTASGRWQTPANSRRRSPPARASSVEIGNTTRSRRSVYRKKLDNALARAHLARHQHGVAATRCGDDADSDFDGFMQRPDDADQGKAFSKSQFVHVLNEARRGQY